MIEAYDIITTLFEKLCTGERTWDKEKYPSFESYFFMLIKSHIFNLTLHEFRMVPFTEDYCYGSGESPKPHANKGSVNLYDSGDDVLHQRKESRMSGFRGKQPGWDGYPQELLLQEFETLCLKVLKDDVDAGIIFLDLLVEDTNKEIAEDLGIDVSMVENAKKRIQRKLLPVYQEYFGKKQK